MTVKTSLSQQAVQEAWLKVRRAQDEFESRYPGEAGARQPVHTVYGGAHIFTAETPRKLGDVALRALETYAAEPRDFAAALDVPAALADRVYERVIEKLRREPVEDFRIDFEDGYGNRPDDEEDGHAASAAREVARGLAASSLPPFLGIRIKPLTRELGGRAIRTLDIFVSELAHASGGALPPWFAVTLPKITTPGQVETLAALLGDLEQRTGLPAGGLRIEIMVETTQSILD